jgi:hypothetical protein
MSSLNIDALYAAFVETLPREVRGVAARLPFRLRLSPREDASWREAFRHELTLSAPALFADALPGLSPALVRDAGLSHLLAVLEIRVLAQVMIDKGRDRAALRVLLSHLTDARRKVSERLGPGTVAAFEMARSTSERAVDEERQLLLQLEAVGFEEYRSITLAKHSVGFPATLGLAQAAGVPRDFIRMIDRTLRSAWLAVQLESDVLDWEEEWRKGGAWAASLARGMRVPRRGKERQTEPDLLRRAVLASGALGAMLAFSRLQFRATWRRACMIGAERLSAWALERQQHIALILLREHESAGYAVRERKLLPWAREVFR